MERKNDPMESQEEVKNIAIQVPKQTYLEFLLLCKQENQSLQARLKMLIEEDVRQVKSRAN